MADFKCIICGELKPLNKFPSDKSRKSGFRSTCRVCYNQRQREQYIPKPDNYKLEKVSYVGELVDGKRCRGCNVILPLTDYYKSSHCLGGVAPRCKKCNGAKGLYEHASLVKLVQDGIEVEGKKCVKCLKVRPMESFTVISSKRKGIGGRYARCRRCENIYRNKLQEVPERRARYLAKSREYTQEYKVRKRHVSKIHRVNNIERYRVKDANRWARKKLLRDELTRIQYEEIVCYFDNACALTGGTNDLTLEHFIPLSVGHGGSYVGNVYPSIGGLNYSKNDTNPFIWYKRKDIQTRIDKFKWDHLIKYLAAANGMSNEKYEDYVYWCFANPRTLDDLAVNNTDSLILYMEQNYAGNF